MKGVRRFGIQGKLAPCYISPYPIIDKYGPMSYQVELAAKLSGVHNVCHVSQLKRCLKPLADAVIEDTIPLKLDLTYKVYPIKVLDQQDRVTHNKTTRFHKIQWNDHSEDEARWEHEGNHPIPVCFYAFTAISGRDFFYGGRAVTPHVTKTLIKVIGK
jgi:hypothetical protein